MTARIPMKELKFQNITQGISRKEIQTDNKDSRDYSQIDPALKSTVTTVSRPTEHGTPIVPYIPGPTPPYPPKHDRFDSPPPA
ncbi:hypothetical protein NC651_003003 [Populus alba x Populus x berolinensis]|nr:hypothetical protein NC651_003003 [Populus alba x Populus x berolinensis]